jgi:N-acyl homoserine lactone hydrolase
MNTPCPAVAGAAAVLLLTCFGVGAAATERSPPAATATGLRLYVLDCGAIHVVDTMRYELRRDEVASADLAVPCFLVVHPKGALLWDTGAVPDAEWTPTGSVVVHRLALPDGQSRDIDLTRALGPQLRDIGHPPESVQWLALSHYHYDHTANANAFRHATWLVRKIERDAMFATPPPGTTRPDTYAALREARTQIIDADERDVFGDGQVVIKFAPGHTPGHQMLLVRLARTGPVLLSGDLYHYPEERTLNRFPVFEFDREQSRRTRVAVEKYLAATGAQLWIQHDAGANATRRKSPAWYD